MDALAYDDTGRGPAIVFLHGITCDRSNWRPVVDLLADRFRCVNVDLAGHGESPRTGAYDVFSQAGSVAAFLTAREIDRPLVVGHSYGAFVATLVGASGAVSGVVNVDQELDTAAFKERIAPFERRLRSDDFESAFLEFAAGLHADLVPEERRHLVAMRPDRDVVLGAWETVFDTPATDLVSMVEPTLSSYPVPYLALYGNRISAEEQRLVGLLPDVQVEVWEGLGHFVMLADPRRTADRIARFAEQR